MATKEDDIKPRITIEFIRSGNREDSVRLNKNAQQLLWEDAVGIIRGGGQQTLENETQETETRFAIFGDGNIEKYAQLLRGEYTTVVQTINGHNQPSRR